MPRQPTRLTKAASPPGRLVGRSMQISFHLRSSAVWVHAARRYSSPESPLSRCHLRPHVGDVHRPRAEHERLQRCLYLRLRRPTRKGSPVAVRSLLADLAEAKVIFDTSRNWCSLIPALCELFPTARVVCCVRSPAWILDSIERHVQQNALGMQRMFNHDPKGNEYTRVEALTGKDGFVKRARGNLRQAWFGEFAGRLIAVRYESLVQQPKETIGCTTRSPSRDTLTISIESSTTNRCSMQIWASRAFTAFQVQSEPARGKQSFHRNFLPSAINASGVPKTRIPAAC